MTYLRDVQIESQYIVNRWTMSDAVGSQIVVDDVGGIVLPLVGAPVLGQPSLVRGDSLTCARGGYAGALSGYQASVSTFVLTNGVTVEGATARDPNAVTFNLFNAPGQTSLVIAGANVQFSVWTGAQHTLTATGPITGPAQLVTGTYDPVAQLQTIYVDGVQVAQQALSSAVALTTTGNTQLLVATSSSTCAALGQDVAVYNGALPQSRVTQHYQAFAQTWTDPGHVVNTYPAIGVFQ